MTPGLRDGEAATGMLAQNARGEFGLMTTKTVLIGIGLLLLVAVLVPTPENETAPFSAASPTQQPGVVGDETPSGRPATSSLRDQGREQP